MLLIKMREKFYFFWTFRETAQAIEDSKARLEYLEAVIMHGLGEEEKELTPLVNALMVQTRFTLDRSQDIAAERSEAWKKWWDAKSKAMKWNQNAKKNWGFVAKQNKTEQDTTKQNEEEVEVEEEIEIEEEREKENKEKDSTATPLSSYSVNQEARISYMNWMRNVERWGQQLINRWNSITHNQEVMNEELKKSIYNLWSIPISTFEERVKKYQEICDMIKEKKLEKFFYYTIWERDLIKFISKINWFYWENSVIIWKIAHKELKDRAVKVLTTPTITQTTETNDPLSNFY